MNCRNELKPNYGLMGLWQTPMPGVRLPMTADNAKLPAAEAPPKLLTPLQRAMQEWEQMTTPCPKIHYDKETAYREEFRQYGQAVAWIELESDCIQITKIEPLLQARKGAVKQLVELLKGLADKYHVRLYGTAVVYPPDPPVPVGELRSQKELEDWYKGLGFQLRRMGGKGLIEIWYPDAPQA